MRAPIDARAFFFAAVLEQPRWRSFVLVKAPPEFIVPVSQLAIMCDIQTDRHRAKLVV